MREGLAREFPEATRAAAWTRGRVGGRRPALWTEPVLWATISGIGAGFLVGAVTQALVGLTGEALQALRAPLPALFPLVTIAATAAATAVTTRAGGLAALAFYVAYIALGVALAIPGVTTFCERSGGSGFPLLLGTSRCSVLGFVVSLWPQFIGVGLGIAMARAITERGTGINSLLRIAGGYALANFVMSQVWAATIAQSTNVLATGLTLAAGTVAAAVAAGALAAQLPNGIRNAAIVGGILLVPWATRSVPFGLRSIGTPGVPAEFVSTMLITLATPPIVAAFMVLSAALTSRARFIPRDTA
jgi:hypothetical protein